MPSEKLKELVGTISLLKWLAKLFNESSRLFYNSK